MINEMILELYAVNIFSPSSEKESELIKEGYVWFNIFKRLLVDVTFSSNLLMQSQNRFADINTKEALKLVAIELSFLYDILHTKAVHVHCISGRVLRCCSLASIITALIVFHHLDVRKYASVDIIITYILFGAGLGLEVIATVLLVFSDWTVVSLSEGQCLERFAHAIPAMVKGTLRNEKPRWSHTIGQYNLVRLCLRDRDTIFAWIMRKLKIKDKWNNMRETESIPLPEGLDDIMFTEAKRRAQNVHIYNVLIEARSYRGSKTLERYGQQKTLEWSMKKEFDECIILWHVATYICFHTVFSNQSNGKEPQRDVSWKVSNYMVYLLTQQPSMMQLGYGKTRFEDTCAVVKKKFEGHRTLKDEEALKLLQQITNNPLDPFVQELLKQQTNNSVRLKQGLLVLADGRQLAQQLQALGQKLKWQLISETWMEMLGYAAIHCDSYQHAKSLSRGGELLTHFWLLMAQMGVVEEHKMQQFQSVSV
jgi:Domain of unknown function (DUF4220)/Protein of unknown function, DUF594